MPTSAFAVCSAGGSWAAAASSPCSADINAMCLFRCRPARRGLNLAPAKLRVTSSWRGKKLPPPLGRQFAAIAPPAPFIVRAAHGPTDGPHTPVPGETPAIPVEHKPDIKIARAALVLCTIFWAVYYPLVRWTYKVLAPGILASTLSLQRSLLTSLLLVPLLARKPAHPASPSSPAPRRDWPRLLLDGVSIGTLSFCGNALGALALHHTTSNRATLLSSLNIVFAGPLAILCYFVNRWLKRARGEAVLDDVREERRLFNVPRMSWSAVALAVGGALVVTQEAGLSAALRAGAVQLSSVAEFVGSFNKGDVMCIVESFFYGAHIVRLSAVSRRYAPGDLAVVKRAWITVLSFAWALVERRASSAAGLLNAAVQVPSLSVLGVVAILAIFPGCLSTWLQNFGQESVPAQEAAIIYALQLVWVPVISFALLGERMGPLGALGAALIFAGVYRAGQAQA